MKLSIQSFILICFFLQGTALAERPEYEDNDVYAKVIIRSADQLAAFYHGREFPQRAIDEILKVCLVTPIIKNKRFDRMWIDLDAWEFSVADEKVERLNRSYWKVQWQKIMLPLRHQATFGWTLMPEKRDLRVDEGVGGSVIIPWQDKPVDLLIQLPVEQAKEQSGKVKKIMFKGLLCSGN